MARIAGVNIPNHQHIVIALRLFLVLDVHAQKIFVLRLVSIQPKKSRTWMTTISKNSVMKSVNS